MGVVSANAGLGGVVGYRGGCEWRISIATVFSNDCPLSMTRPG